MHLNSQRAFQRYAIPYLRSGQVVLEVGPDGDPSTYRQEADHLELNWQTADLATELLPVSSTFRPAVRPTHAMRNEYEIPLPDGAVDVVLAGQVIEHVRKVWTWMRELARVVRPGGHVIIISPISWPFHEAPIDCWRIYPDGMRALCVEASLSVDLCEQVALEPQRSRNTYLGESWEYLVSQGGCLRRLEGLAKGAVGWPMPTALDLITVATKTPTRLD